MTQSRLYDALLLDLDGTLLDAHDRVPDATRAVLERAQRAGVVVMIATGRSNGGARDIALEVTRDMPAVVYNGAALYDPKADQIIEHSTVPRAAVERILGFAKLRRILPVIATSSGQYARPAESEVEAVVLADFRHLHITEGALPQHAVIRVTLLSAHHATSDALRDDVQDALRAPAYLTHFPLDALPQFQKSPVQVVDIQPDCDGKALGLRVLRERFGIAASRVVAVGDADNDIPMLEAAGLGVAMGNATEPTKQAARRVIGHHDSTALAELIEELFLAGDTPSADRE